MNNIEFIKAKKAELNILSAQAKERNAKSINDGLKSIYKEHGHTELRTFDEWKAKGFSIKRGAQAIYLWSKKQTKKIVDNGTEKEIFYFRMKPLFSNLQVYQP